MGTSLKVKVQQAANNAADLLNLQGCEVCDLDLYNAWIGYAKLYQYKEVYDLVIAMMEDHKKVCDSGVFL